MSALSLSLTWEGHRVRMVGTPDRPEWIAKDVCRALCIHSTANALANAGVTAEEKGVARIHTPGGPQDVTAITESGLWKLVLISRRPSARRLKAWLAEEVLPCLRKHGCWPAPTIPSLNVDLRDPRMLAALALQLTDIVREKDERLAVVEPKAEVYDEVMSAEGSYSVAEAAQLLARLPHRPMGERRLFAFMREHGITQADNRPYQVHVDEGRFVVIDKAWKDSDDERHAYFQTRVTQKGVEYLLRRLDAADGQRNLLPARAVVAEQEIGG